MIFFKTIMILFSLNYISNGKDYLVEVEDGHYNENEYIDIQIRVRVFTLFKH